MMNANKRNVQRHTFELYDSFLSILGDYVTASCEYKLLRLPLSPPVFLDSHDSNHFKLGDLVVVRVISAANVYCDRI